MRFSRKPLLVKTLANYPRCVPRIYISAGQCAAIKNRINLACHGLNTIVKEKIAYFFEVRTFSWERAASLPQRMTRHFVRNLALNSL